MSQGQERLPQAEGQQPGEEEDEELARDGSRRRVRLHRIVQGQVHDADRSASTSEDFDAGSLLFTEDAFWGSDAGARLGPGLAAIIYAMIFF